MIRLTRKGADVCILGADLNTEPGDLMYRIIRHNSPIKDLFSETGKVSFSVCTRENLLKHLGF